jgi:hypothetical protein
MRLLKDSPRLAASLVPGTTPDKMAVTGADEGRLLPLDKVAGIPPVCMNLSWFQLPGTSRFSGEHGRKPAQLLQLNSETDAVGMTIFADKGMGIPISGKVIENISHYFCLDTAEGKLTPIMSGASEVTDR